LTYVKKNFFLIFFLIYFCIGSFYSLNTGLSFDEVHEQNNWEYNLALAKSILFKTQLDPTFYNYGDKYFGIGFQIISQPIQLLLSNIILNFQEIDSEGAHLLAKHFVIFLSFCVSGFFVYLILLKINNNKLFCGTSTAIYLLYPYLLGHSLFNPKDIPFLCFWIICTYVSINIFNNLSKYENFNYKEILLISFLTAFLLSIRISGILIFIQYFFTLIIFLHSSKINFVYFIKINYKKIILFSFSIILFTYFLYPVFWKNPLLFFEAISYMGNYFNNVCTLTLGECMYSTNLKATYIPIWFMVKLPFLILLGLILFPLTEKNIFKKKENIIFIGTLLLSSFFIPLILILKKANLYDELRHILFLFPMIFILGVVSLYNFSRKIFYTLSIFTISIFLIENVKIYPYQYAWFNTPSRILNLSKNFELDYWGISGKELAREISSLKNKIEKKPCVLTTWSTRHFLDKDFFSCFDTWSAIDSDIDRPFWAIQNVRNLKKGKTYKCNALFESKFKLLFSKEEFITGRLIKCI